MTELNLGDRLVREMADRHHQPDEVWTIAGELLGVHCETCHQSWPCQTRRALDDTTTDGEFT